MEVWKYEVCGGVGQSPRQEVGQLGVRQEPALCRLGAASQLEGQVLGMVTAVHWEEVTRIDSS